MLIKRKNPKKTQTECLASVSLDGKSIKHLTLEQQTPEVCWAALKQDPLAFIYTDPNALTEEMCLYAIEKLNNRVEYLTIPTTLQTTKVCLAAIKHHPHFLFNISPQKRTKEIILAALKQNGALINGLMKTITKDHPDAHEYCLAAVSSYGNIIAQIPNDMLTEEICIAAVTNNPNVIRFLLPQARTYAVRRTAVAKDGYTIQYLSPAEREIDICVAAVLKTPAAIVMLTPEELELVKPYLDYAKNEAQDIVF